ncbi:hypothetical protein Pan97_24580 [Bremerella volcania]|uniref:Uncharacterized protein n=1 Tax=Bremerella volcania TaxID=2527984 RepID=A0A518C867_9BACT|nr:hypothetical protein [Bremerella volcania]QDU75426.1 hypothetical protein Pan97_24580 [Bremerella volcania]
MGILIIRNSSPSFVLSAPDPLPDYWESATILDDMLDNFLDALDVYDISGALRSYIETYGQMRADALITARVKDIEAGSGTANVDKAVKRQEVETKYAEAIAAGYGTGLGFSLKLGEQDQRVLFDYQQRLLRQLSQPSPQVALADVKVVKGTDDTWHLATVEQIIVAIDGGAGHVESLNGAYAGYEAMLAAGVVDFVVAF